MILEYFMVGSGIAVMILFVYIGLTKDRVNDSMEPQIAPLTMAGGMGAVNAAPIAAYNASNKEDEK